MTVSIGGLAKTLPAPYPASPASPASPAPDGTGRFGSALGSATAASEGRLANPSSEATKAVVAAKTAIAAAHPRADLPIRNFPDPIKIKDGRQAVAVDGKNEPDDDAGTDETVADAPADDDRKTVATASPWAPILPAPQHVILPFAAPTPAVAPGPAPATDFAAKPADPASAAVAEMAAPALQTPAPPAARSGSLPGADTQAPAAPTEAREPRKPMSPAAVPIASADDAGGATTAPDLPAPAAGVAVPAAPAARPAAPPALLVSLPPVPAPTMPVAPSGQEFSPIAAEPGLVIPIARVPAGIEPSTAAEDGSPSADTAGSASDAPSGRATGATLAAAAAHRALPPAGAASSSGDRDDSRQQSDRAAPPIDMVGAGTSAAPPSLASVAGAQQASPTAPATDAVLDVRDPAWMATLVDKMVESRDASGHAITMALRPDALGSVEVSLRHSGGQLHVVFTAADPAARTLLADARSQLASLAADRGVDLASATVTGGGAGMAGHGAGGRPDPRPQATPFARWSPARFDLDDGAIDEPATSRAVRERTA